VIISAAAGAHRFFIELDWATGLIGDDVSAKTSLAREIDSTIRKSKISSFTVKLSTEPTVGFKAV